MSRCNVVKLLPLHSGLCYSDRQNRYFFLGSHAVSPQVLHQIWLRVSGGKLPFPSCGCKFDVAEHYVLLGYCCYDAAKEFAKLVVPEQQVPFHELSQGNGLSYDDYCALVRLPT